MTNPRYKMDQSKGGRTRITGIGEAALTQAMDQSGMTPLNVTLPGVTGAGQQNAANSVPVALANEQVQDK